MKSLRKQLRKLKRNAAGSTAMMFAITAPVLFGFAALAVDVGLMYSTEAELQRATDEAALAALVGIRNHKYSNRLEATESQVKNDALAMARQNLPDIAGYQAARENDIIFGQWDFDTKTFTPGGSWLGTNAVQVNAHMARVRNNALQTFFGSIFTDKVEIATSSLAVLPIPPGFHAISETASSALKITGSDLDTSQIVVNSTANDALVTESTGSGLHSFGGPRLDIAGKMRVVGSQIHGANKIHEEQPGIRDFLEDQPQPNRSAGCHYVNYKPRPTGNRIFVNPGTYCGLIIEDPVDAVIFRPGEYKFAFLPLVIRNQRRVEGDGVHFFFTGRNGNLEFQDNGDVLLRAQETGPYRGITIMSDRHPSYAPHHIRLTRSTLASFGTIYLPNTDLIVAGGNLNGTCIISCVVADTMQFSQSFVNYYGGYKSPPAPGWNSHDTRGVVHPEGLKTSYRPYLIQQ